MNISKMRELAFKLMYELEVQKEFNEEIMDLFFENNEVDDKNARQYVRKLVRGIKSKEEDLEKIITEKLSPNWNFQRISKINLAILIMILI